MPESTIRTTQWDRPWEPVRGENGAVASTSAPASEVGVRVLQQGGNAVDAAIAAAFANSVVEPFNLGLGGGGGMVIFRAADGVDVAINDNAVAPAAATPDMFELEDATAKTGSARIRGYRGVEDDANRLGYRACAVPGTLAGFALALARYGTMTLAQVLEPAIQLAERGADVSWFTSLIMSLEMESLLKFPEAARLYLKDGYPYKPVLQGDPERLVQTDLAATFRKIAEFGSDVYYRGELGRQIVDHLQANGGIMTMDDLATYEPRVYSPGYGTNYRGHELKAIPCSGGAILVEVLNILEGVDLRGMGHNTARSLNVIAQACNLATADRLAYINDPDQVPVPQEGLRSREYASERRKLIDPTRAIGDFSPGDPWRHEGPPAPGRPPAVPPAAPDRGDNHTFHVSAVDRDRNLVSVTESLADPFGCHVVVPGTGFALNGRMAGFNPEPGWPLSIAPRKRCLMSEASVILLKDGRPLMACGATGGPKIVMGVLQVILNVIEYGLDIQAAVAAPRIDAVGTALTIDDRIPEAVVSELGAMGYQTKLQALSPTNWGFSAPAGVLVDWSRGQVLGGAVPGKTTGAAAY